MALTETARQKFWAVKFKAVHLKYRSGYGIKYNVRVATTVIYNVIPILILSTVTLILVPDNNSCNSINIDSSIFTMIEHTAFS